MEMMKIILKKKANPAFKRFQTLPLLANLSPRPAGAKSPAVAKSAKVISQTDSAAAPLSAGQIQLTN